MEFLFISRLYQDFIHTLTTLIFLVSYAIVKSFLKLWKVRSYSILKKFSLLVL